MIVFMPSRTVTRDARACSHTFSYFVRMNFKLFYLGLICAALSPAGAQDDALQEAAEAPAPAENAPEEDVRNDESEEGGDGPFETLIKRCDSWDFPDSTFSAQADENKVYLKIAKTGEGPFKDQKLVNFASVYGIRILGDEGVPEEKILHVANVLANVLDHDGDGKPDNKKLVEELRTYHPILFIMADAERIMSLMSAQNADEGFPTELKFCPYAFDFEESKKINPGAPSGDATCDADGAKEEGAKEEGEKEDGEKDDGEKEEKGKVEDAKDRTVAFVLDHLMGRGFTEVMGEEREKRLEKIYKDSLEAKTFDPENTGCPPESEECGRVMFASWGLSTLMGFDKCWCEQAKALKFCDAETFKKNEPELAELLEDVFPDVQADQKYEPKNSDSLEK